MQLTAEQVEEVRLGRAVRIDDPDVGAPCIVVRADRYVLSEITDEPLSMREVGLLIEQTMHEYDADDPGLALYQEMRP